MNTNDRLNQRFENFCEALKTIEEAEPRFDNLSTLEQDGLIQRFEYTFELAWKVMQDYLVYVGYKELTGPRNVIKQMGRDDLIDPNQWEEMIGTRNELTHKYSEEQSRLNLNKIINDHFPVLQQFRQTIEDIL